MTHRFGFVQFTSAYYSSLQYKPNCILNSPYRYWYWYPGVLPISILSSQVMHDNTPLWFCSVYFCLSIFLIGIDTGILQYCLSLFWAAEWCMTHRFCFFSLFLPIASVQFKPNYILNSPFRYCYWYPGVSSIPILSSWVAHIAFVSSV